MSKVFQLLFLALVLSAPICAQATGSDEKKVAFKQYQSYFVERESQRYATSHPVFTKRSEFDKFFSPAATMGENTFIPPDVFARNLVLATIEYGGPPREYSDMKVTAAGTTLTVSYHTKVLKAGYTANSFFLLSVDRSTYKDVVFIE